MLHINIESTKVLNRIEKKQWVREILRRENKQQFVIYGIGD